MIGAFFMPGKPKCLSAQNESGIFTKASKYFVHYWEATDAVQFLLILSTVKLKTLNLLFFDFGSGEILLIVIAVFLIFGPSKIPEMARGLGKFINDIKRASEEIKTEINREADRQERDKKLTEYKSQIEKDLEIDDGKPKAKAPDSSTEKTTESAIKETTEEIK